MCMSDKELIKSSIEEFSRLQGYMVDSPKDSKAYKSMKIRYTELKIILQSLGVNLTALDIINE